MNTICDDMNRLDGLIGLGVCRDDGRFYVLEGQCRTTCGRAAVLAQAACTDVGDMCTGPCAAAAQEVYKAGCTENDMYWDDAGKNQRTIMDMIREHRLGCDPNSCMGAFMKVNQECDTDSSSGNELEALMMLCRPNTPCSEALKKPMEVCSDTDMTEIEQDGQQEEVNVKELLMGIQMLCGMLGANNGTMDEAGMAALMAMLAGQGAGGGGGGGSCNNPVHMPRNTPAFQKYPPRACGIASGAVGMSGVASAWLLGLAFLFRQ